MAGKTLLCVFEYTKVLLGGGRRFIDWLSMGEMLVKSIHRHKVQRFFSELLGLSSGNIGTG